MRIFRSFDQTARAALSRSAAALLRSSFMWSVIFLSRALVRSSRSRIRSMGMFVCPVADCRSPRRQVAYFENASGLTRPGRLLLLALLTSHDVGQRIGVMHAHPQH